MVEGEGCNGLFPQTTMTSKQQENEASVFLCVYVRFLFLAKARFPLVCDE